MDTLCQAGIPAGAVLDCEDITNEEIYGGILGLSEEDMVELKEKKVI